MPKKQKPFIVKIVILSAVTAVVWVGASIYKAFSKREEPNVPTQIMQPLTPTLDKKVLDELENRVFLEESQIPETRIDVGAVTPTIQPTETTVPEETPASEEIPVPEETPATEPAETAEEEI